MRRSKHRCVRGENKTPTAYKRNDSTKKKRNAGRRKKQNKTNNQNPMAETRNDSKEKERCQSYIHSGDVHATISIAEYLSCARAGARASVLL